ncbi:MAG: hybrid sensor histidine kinase/response regulator [Candidatus Melainabacteria bacterium]|jgi:signal transduction histidine kinase|nr:hybrid sensor histidine kinase/response regulator [Candidatus Melainabacteria bacterium]
MSKKHLAILLIEDDPIFAAALQALLKRKSIFTFDLLHATTFAQADKVLLQTQFDVILLDLTLPDVSGLDTLHAVRKRGVSCPVIILTGRDEEDLGIQAMKAGAQDYLLKGEIDGRLLSRAITHAIERARLIYEREDFLATLTHDLKNPLIGANRVIELLAERKIGDLNDEQVNLLTHIKNSNWTLLTLIGNLLEVYRFEKDLDTLYFEHTNLMQIVNNCMKEIAPIAFDRNIQVTKEIADESEAIVLADADSLSRVLRNLLDNALKYTPSGGQVKVSVSSSDDIVQLSVSDTGPGIPEEDRKHLFERFWRGRASRRHTPGTGLGLYLCQQIISMHKGKISCTCPSEVGTSFVVELPRENTILAG